MSYKSKYMKYKCVMLCVRISMFYDLPHVCTMDLRLNVAYLNPHILIYTEACWGNASGACTWLYCESMNYYWAVMSERSEDTANGSRHYKEHRIHWARGITILELTRSYWVAGRSHSDRTRSTAVVTRLELHNPLAVWT